MFGDLRCDPGQEQHIPFSVQITSKGRHQGALTWTQHREQGGKVDKQQT